MELLSRTRRGDENLISLRKRKIKQMIDSKVDLPNKYKQFANCILDLNNQLSVQEKLSVLQKMIYLVESSPKIISFVENNYFKEVIQAKEATSDCFLLCHFLFFIAKLGNFQQKARFNLILEEIYSVTTFLQKNADTVEEGFVFEACNLFCALKRHSGKLNVWIKLEVFSVLIFSRQIKAGLLLLSILTDSKLTARQINDEFVADYLSFSGKFEGNPEDYLNCLDKIVTNEFSSLSKMTFKAVLDLVDLTNFRLSPYFGHKVRLAENMTLILPGDMFYWLKESKFLDLLCQGALVAQREMSTDCIYALLRLFLAFDNEECCYFLTSSEMKEVYKTVIGREDETMTICLLEGLVKLISSTVDLRDRLAEDWLNTFLVQQNRRKIEKITELTSEVFEWLFCRTIED